MPTPSLLSPTGPSVPTLNSPDRWARFLEDHAPGLTWLASTLLEWADLPPGARKAWLVTAQATRAGDIEGLAALHEASGLLAVAALPGTPPPLFGEPDRVRRLVGTPETVEATLRSVPVLMLRRGAGERRLVFVHDAEPPPARHPDVQRARPGVEESAEALRTLAGEGSGGVLEADLRGDVLRGALFTLTRDRRLVGLFRVDGVARRRIQVVDACIHPDAREDGLGSALLSSAASVARTEYARGCVLTVPATDAAERTALRAGFAPAGLLDDVRFA